MIISMLSFVFFTVLVAGLTWRFTKNDDHDSTDGYFLGGRSLSFPLIAGSLLLTNLSTEQLVGLNGAAFADGLCVMVWEVVCVVALVFMAWFFLPRFLRSGVTTVPEYLNIRFDKQTQLFTNVIFLLAYLGILLPIILYSGAKGMVEILDVSSMVEGPANLIGVNSETLALWLIVWLVGLIGAFYALFGGLRTVAVSDTLNGIGLFVGGFLISGFALVQLSDGQGVVEGANLLMEQYPERFNSVGSSDSSVPFGAIFSGIFLINLFYWTTNQQIIQRTFGASSLAEGQKGVLLTGAFKLLGPLYLVIPGILAFAMLGTTLIDGKTVPVKDFVQKEDELAVVVTLDGEESIFHGDDAYELLGVAASSESKQVAPSVAVLAEKFESKSVPVPKSKTNAEYEVVRVLPVGTVISTNADGENHYSTVEDLTSIVPPRSKDSAYGRLVRKVLPAPLTGFFAAVLIGAILSSFNSALNSSCTLFGLGFYSNVINRNATEEQQVRSGKIFGWIVAVAAMSIAPLLAGQKSIFDYLQKMNGMYFIPIFAVVLVGMLTKRVPALAAKIALLVGFIGIAVGYFVYPFNAIVASLHEFHFLGLMFAWLVILMLVIGEVCPRETEFEQEDVKAVDMTPWKLAKPAGLLLIACVLTIYVVFADFSVL